VATQVKPQRIALVVHPTRAIDGALETLRGWAEQLGVALVQPRVVGGAHREVAAEGALGSDDLVVALGGDGTILSALRAATPVEAPVLGVSCGSLAALAAVSADGLGPALDRFVAGDWTPRRLPALEIRTGDGPKAWAVNDFVIVRRRATQVIAELRVDDELYARIAGDGLIVASPLGSSAYSMAAGGPILLMGTPAIVCTPLAIHGGNAPPLVVPMTSKLRVTVQPTYGGFELEIDGHLQEIEGLEFELFLHRDKIALVTFGERGLGLAMLRDRGLIADSPRVLARDRRAQPSPRSVR
jgi:NAD+ kinase